MVRFACPGCSTPYSTADEHAGKRTTCKACGAKFLIPTDADEGPPPAAPPPLPYVLEAGSSLAPPVPQEEPTSLAPPAAEPPPPPPEVPVELKPCPKCAAKMSVRPDDVGHDLECPFCQTVFRGEAATPEPAAVPPPAPEPEPEGVDIAPCPKCRAELTVAPDDVGGEVECPFCQTVYLAEKPKPKPNTLLARPSARPAAPTQKAPPPPPPKGKNNLEEDDGDTTPIKVKREKERDDDDEDDDRPRKKKKRRRRRPSNDPYDPYDADRHLTMEPSDGVACLLYGLASFFCCVIIAFWAIPHCRDTMAKADAGIMDKSAKPMALIGLIFAYLGIGLFVLNLVGICCGGLGGGGRG